VLDGHKVENLRELHSPWLEGQNNSSKQEKGAVYERTENEPYFIEILPVYVGTLTPENNILKNSGSCFRDSQIELKPISNQGFELTHTVGDASGLLCSDVYIYSTLLDFDYKFLFFSGSHKVKFDVSPKEFEQISQTGIYVLRLSKGFLSWISCVFKGAGLFMGGFGLDPEIPFFGGKPTSWQTQANIEFVRQSQGYEWQERPLDVVVDIDESLLQSGDFLAVTRFDGIDQLIEYGTGSHVGHCVMILKVDGETYVVESQDAWYWPRRNIQINTYKQWVEWARNADFQVGWVPLKKEYAEKFNSTAAYEFFKSLEGTQYGFHNFIFGWIDTPDQSYPPGLSVELGPVIFSMLEKVIPEPVQFIFSNGLNKRLGTENLTVPEIVLETKKRGMTLNELVAVPEQEEWRYPSGASYVCSSLVIALYKAGGLFGDLEINAPEFTPRDVYQLDFFDKNPPVPDHCKQVDPENPFCQIMGKYRIEFKGIGTVSPYSNMNERCSSMTPFYHRLPANC